MIHCNLDKYTAGSIIYDVLRTVVEKCNIINNEQCSTGSYLVYDTGETTLKDCVISNNTHSKLSGCSRTSSVNSFFCKNAFSHLEEEKCAQTLCLQLNDALFCKGCSFRFTALNDTIFFRVFLFHFIIP